MPNRIFYHQVYRGRLPRKLPAALSAGAEAAALKGILVANLLMVIEGLI